MSLNLIDLVSKEFSGDALKKIASSLGEPELKVKTAVSGAAPVLVAALASKATTGTGLTDILDLMRKGGFDGHTNGLTSQIGASSLTDLVTRGGSMAASLLGDRQTSVITWLASMAGIAPRSATALLGLAAPTLLSLLGGRLRYGGGFTPSGLSQILGDQADHLRNAAPVGLTSALGLSDFSTLSATPRAAAALPAPPKETDWWPWVAALVVAVVAGWWLFGRQPAGTIDPQVSAAEKPVVHGLAAYRERMALLPGAVFEATLEDVSRPDAKAEVLGTFRKLDPGQGPIRFEIPYDPAKVDQRHTYAMRARILKGDTLAFTTDKVYPVLTRGSGNEVELLLVRVMSARPPNPK
jgi:uncharacterized lipoprotein YbaY